MEKKVELKRVLGLWEVTLSGVGIILGAGIYALIGEAAGLAGNAVWIAFALSALVAMVTGLSYAELSSMFPRASAEYEYTYQAFGRRLAFVIGWLIIFSGVIGAATVALGFAGYLNALFGASRIPSALILVVILSGIIFVGIRQSAWIAIIFTLIEALGLIIIIILGIPYLGSVNYLEMPLGIRGLFQASALIFFAFIGFEEIVKLSEEAREPEKIIPKALILAIGSSIVLYVLVAISAVSVMGWQDLSLSSAPFADIANAAFGRNAFFALSTMALFATTNTVLLMLLAIGSSIVLYVLVAISAVSVMGWQDLSLSSAPFADIANAAFGQSAFFILSVMALFATTNTVLLMLLAASRIIYGMADSLSLPEALGKVHPVTRTPWVAILTCMIFCMGFVLLEDIALVANINNFTVFVTFIAINAALIFLRYKRPEAPRPFKVPLVAGRLPFLPLLGIILNSFMLIQLTPDVIAIGIGLTLIGILVALALDRSRVRKP